MTNRPKRRFEIRKAVRSSAPPIIGVTGPANSGKTYSSLLLAKGYAGAGGRFGIADTEAGRGEIFAMDPVVGGYEVLPVDTPHDPYCFMDLIDQANEMKLDALVIDSFSHEWEGDGGVLQWAEEEAERMTSKGVPYDATSQSKWIKPKAAHGQLIRKIQRSKVIIFACMRAKQKMRDRWVEKGGRRKREVYRDENWTPIQSEDFFYEMTLGFNLEDKGMVVRYFKEGESALLSCMPAVGQRIELRHGEMLRRWVIDGDRPADPLATLRAEVAAAASAAWKADQNMAAEEGASIFGSGVKVSEAVAACTDETKLREAKRRFDGVVAFCAKADGGVAA